MTLVEMLRHHEGVRNKPYRCPAQLWTVGVGRLLYPEQATLKMQDRLKYPLRIEDFRIWSDKEINELLEQDLARFARGVDRLCPITTPGQRDALISFAFNVGLGNLQRSTIRMKHNRGDYAEASEAFMMWTKAGGRVLNGLVKRRKDERALYESSRDR